MPSLPHDLPLPQFGENALTCRYEDYFIHAIKRTSAYVQGEWDSQPA